MTFAPGTRLGPYEIRSARALPWLGEAYDALDHEQQRKVTLRVLRTDFATSPDRLKQFEQEARAAALLDHPNILTVHDVGTDAQAAYIVSEPIEGATLRESLGGGALPVATVVARAARIARGLAAAHDKGVVHRDLTPEHILVTPDGSLKVAGFGLAAVTQIESSVVRGVPRGTPAYMSPEQVRGEVVDRRSDMFTFGAIVYEMLTGARAFAGDTPIETMTAVLKSEPPPFSAPGIPPVLARIVDLSLQKNPGSRLSAEDVVIGLQRFWAQAAPAAAAAVPVIPVTLRRVVRVAAVLGAIALAVLAGLWLLRAVRTARVSTPTSSTPTPSATPFATLSPTPSRSAPPSTRPPSTSTPTPRAYDIYEKAITGTGEEVVIVDAQGDQIAFDWSSDGRYVVYQTDQPRSVAGGNLDLWARPFGSRPFAYFRTVHAASRATLSPDGRWVAYTSVEGGREDVFALRFPRPGGRFRVSARGGSWSRWGGAGREVFYLDPDNRMMAVAVKAGSSGVGAGPARPLFQVRARPDRGYPYDVSADGQRFLVNLSP